MRAKTKDHYSDVEAERRATAALRVALSTPYKPQADMKLGKSKGKASKSPRKKRR